MFLPLKLLCLCLDFMFALKYIFIEKMPLLGFDINISDYADKEGKMLM